VRHSQHWIAEGRSRGSRVIWNWVGGIVFGNIDGLHRARWRREEDETESRES